MKYYNWQQEAATALEKNNFQGIVEGCTASGKSILGMGVFEILKYPPTLLIAPTVKIASQWYQYLLDFDIPRKQIGLLGDGHNDINRKYIVGVINSFRGKLFDNHKLVIYDEVHGMGSPENIKFLRANKHIPYKIGLTATLERSDGLHSELKKLIGPVVYSYSQEDGIKDKVINDYTTVNIGVDLTTEENILLIEQEKIIEKLFPIFNKNFIYAQRCLKNPKLAKDAARVLRAFNARKQILYKARNKIKGAIEIIKQYQNEKIITFGESIEYISGFNKAGVKTMVGLAEELQKNSIKFTEYHSKTKTNLKDYEEGDTNVLTTCKKIDEGYDFTKVNKEIVLAGTSKPRQFIQRSGRILRTYSGNDECIVFQLYVRGTQDEVWLRKRMSKSSKKNVVWK